MNSWECIVIDGFSTDGTWEKLQSTADTDKRFKLFQYPANGPYDAWNKGIKKATGKYIYIATADDTMQLNLLEVMSKELDAHEDCGLAHCKLTIIDEASTPSTLQNWDHYYVCQYFGDLMNQKHIRVAPLDGILHCGLKTVYTSITQLLIRKQVFDKLGLFLTNGGSIADFEWGMRVSLIYNTLHIPEYLATWRVHGKQITTDDIQTNKETYIQLQQFIDHAFTIALLNKLPKKYYSKQLKNYYAYIENNLSIRKRITLKLKLFNFSNNYFQFILNIILPKAKFLSDNVKWIKEVVKKMKLENNIIKII